MFSPNSTTALELLKFFFFSSQLSILQIKQQKLILQKLSLSKPIFLPYLEQLEDIEPSPPTYSTSSRMRGVREEDYEDRRGLLGHTRWEERQHFEIGVTVRNWSDGLFFFLLKEKKNLSVKEEGRQATLQTSLDRGNLLPSARELIQTIDPCYKGHKMPCLSPPQPSLQVLTTTLKFVSVVFFPQPGQHLLTLFNSTCSQWCYLTGIFQPFHFTSASL